MTSRLKRPMGDNTPKPKSKPRLPSHYVTKCSKCNDNHLTLNCETYYTTIYIYIYIYIYICIAMGHLASSCCCTCLLLLLPHRRKCAITAQPAMGMGARATVNWVHEDCHAAAAAAPSWAAMWSWQLRTHSCASLPYASFLLLHLLP